MVLMMMMRDAERESFTHATDTPPSMMRAMLPPPPSPSRSCASFLFSKQKTRVYNFIDKRLATRIRLVTSASVVHHETDNVPLHLDEPRSAD